MKKGEMEFFLGSCHLKTKKPKNIMDLDHFYFKNKLKRKIIGIDKLKRDVNAILGKSSGENPEPELSGLPDGAFQRLRNNEIWEQVLQYITHAVDVKNTYFACPAFQPYLRERRLTDLYPIILSVLVGKKYLRTNYNEHRPETSAILATRLISKRTKRNLESEYFEYLLTSKDWHVKSGECAGAGDNFGLNVCVFRRRNQVEAAFSALGETHFGHCFIRCLRIYDDGTDYVNRIIDFLDVHGSVVWGLDYRSETFTEENYEVLHDIVCRTPNLKALSLTSSSTFRGHRQALQDLLRIHPFPRIPLLEFLDFTTNFYPPFMAHIMQKNDQVKTLRLLGAGQHQFSSDHFSILEWVGGLENLKLEWYAGPYYPRTVITHGQPEWPLKVLHLCLDRPNKQIRRFKDNDLFPALNRFASTLEELALEHDIEKVELEEDGLCKTKLDLPHLKKLALLGDQENESGRRWFDWNYNESRAWCISLGDLVGLTSIEVMKFSRPVHSIGNYFKAFPELKFVQIGWRDGDENPKIYRRNNPQNELRPAPKQLTMYYADAVKGNNRNGNG